MLIILIFDNALSLSLSPSLSHFVCRSLLSNGQSVYLSLYGQTYFKIQNVRNNDLRFLMTFPLSLSVYLTMSFFSVFSIVNLNDFYFFFCRTLFKVRVSQHLLRIRRNFLMSGLPDVNCSELPKHFS